MQPLIRVSVMVERCFEVLRADRVIIVVLISSSRVRVILTGAPTMRDSSAASNDIVRFRLAAKAAAEQGHIDGDVRFVDAEDLGDSLAELRS
jgi:hypothetical protein